jgi:hypothetical protein
MCACHQLIIFADSRRQLDYILFVSLILLQQNGDPLCWPPCSFGSFWISIRVVISEQFQIALRFELNRKETQKAKQTSADDHFGKKLFTTRYVS